MQHGYQYKTVLYLKYQVYIKISKNRSCDSQRGQRVNRVH